MTRGHIFLARNRYTGLPERVYVAHRDRVKQVGWLLVSLLWFVLRVAWTRTIHEVTRSRTKQNTSLRVSSWIVLARQGNLSRTGLLWLVGFRVQPLGCCLEL